MLFAVDIGNTEVHCAVFEGERMLHFFRIGTDAHRTSHEYALTFSSMLSMLGGKAGDIDGAVIGSVAPSVTARVREAVALFTGTEPLTVGPGVKTGFPIKLDDPSQLGADLAANAAAVASDGVSPAVIVDFGTATTVSLIGKGCEFLGCSIMPGVQMSLDALNSTELLPGVWAENKVDLLGKNTVSAMLSGVIRGSAAAVCATAESFLKKAGARNAPIYVTGGFAPLMLPYMDEKCIHRPHLTLEGLAAIYRKNTK
ncbi:MAG: type III pantothenate kinase [Clostridia bacterium]|nr:type III pantothenate kinase [Clostridia bacterium]